MRPGGAGGRGATLVAVDCWSKPGWSETALSFFYCDVTSLELNLVTFPRLGALIAFFFYPVAPPFLPIICYIEHIGALDLPALLGVLLTTLTSYIKEVYSAFSVKFCFFRAKFSTVIILPSKVSSTRPFVIFLSSFFRN